MPLTIRVLEPSFLHQSSLKRACETGLLFPCARSRKELNAYRELNGQNMENLFIPKNGDLVGKVFNLRYLKWVLSGDFVYHLVEWLPLWINAWVK